MLANYKDANVKKLLIGLLSAMLLMASYAYAAYNIDEAIKAYDKGNYSKAIKLFKLDAIKGLDFAQFRLGLMYDIGQGTKQDYVEAVKWYKLAAAQGNALAQYNLGLMYANGQGVAQDYAEAVKWYKLAAAQGYASAQFNLGFMYANGKGVAQDYVIAHMWFNLAAVSGDASAVKNRDIAAAKMTQQQLAEAQILARGCAARKYKGC